MIWTRELTENMRSLIVTFVLLINIYVINCKVQTLTPQMGWNSWNKFACNISESLIKETADALISTGLADIGYNYLNLDDCWHADARDSSGRVQANTDRFPSGLKALGDYIHAKGLKFGIYSSAGFKTCQGYPASLGLEDIDAKSYLEWGVDYLKYDNCYEDFGLPEFRYQAMAQAIQSTGRNIFYSLCEWGRENPAAWASSIGAQSWRISGDIRDDWSSILSRAEISAPLWRHSGPNRGWNDPDMLEVGNGHCSDVEYRSHFSLWAMLKAPLLIGNDIRNISSDILEILTNKEVIAVNQDALGRQGRITWSDVSANLLPDTYGQRVIAAPCYSSDPALSLFQDSMAAQGWQVTTDGKIKNTAENLCLSEHPPLLNDKLSSLGDHFNFTLGLRAVSAVSCDSSQATTWKLEAFAGGSIISESSGLCLEVAKFEYLPVVQGKRIQTAPCQNIKDKSVNVREHQSWTFPSKVLMKNLYQRQCLVKDEDAFPGLFEEIWTTVLSNNALAVVLLNKGPTTKTMKLDMTMLGNVTAGKYRARDLWEHRDLLQVLSSDNALEFVVPSHGSVMLKLTPFGNGL